MKLSWTQVCARRLARHHLAEPAAGLSPADVVADMAGTHAQVMSAAELGVALRMAGATRQTVRDALWRDRSLVKTYGPRGTVHLLPAADLPMWLGVLQAVPWTAYKMPGDVAMTAEQTEQVVAAAGDALLDRELTIDELDAEVVARTGPWAGDLVMPAFQTFWPRWRQAVHLAAHRGVLCFGPQRGRKVTYTNPRATAMPAQEALAAIVPLYLRAYGPATPGQFAHWLNAPKSWAGEVFGRLDLEEVEVEGRRAYVAKGDTEAPAEPPRGVRLLPYFDTYAYVVGNQPKELLHPGRAAERVLGRNYQTLVVDGVVAGLWHQRRSGRRLDVTVEALVPLGRRQLAGWRSRWCGSARSCRPARRA
ncbi:winged helix DNA-binding domain-containing protein [Thermoactinospora rubra]|uniref:winged helix DNA-binding domain-containing protein n=1 Tax=Thermoactinospora rubra TaxID=1088767 RepID=UPI001F0AB450|nr:winged helix DNA-binding domain-containing protein [Thermoactinospora rubra]